MAVQSNGLDWQYILRAADRQGVSPLLCRWVEEHGDGWVPEETRAALQSARWVTHFHNRTLHDALRDVLRAADAADMPVMPLKGAILAHHYYPAPDLRPMSDLDLLVRPEHVEKMGEMLRGLGYAAVPRSAPLLDAHLRDPMQREYAVVAERAGMSVAIEYRTEPLDPLGAPLDPRLSARLLVHAARMWERGTPDAFDGAPFVRVAPTDLLLHITSHLATRHAGLRLVWLHDTARVLLAHRNDLDWPAFFRDAEALGLTVPVTAALHAAHRWLDAPAIPHHDAGRPSLTRAAERWGSARQIAALGHADLTTDRDIGGWEAATALLRMRGLRPRLRALRWALLPSPAYLDGWRREHGLPAAGYRTLLARRYALHLRYLLGAVMRGGRRLGG